MCVFSFFLNSVYQEKSLSIQSTQAVIDSILPTQFLTVSDGVVAWAPKSMPGSSQYTLPISRSEKETVHQQRNTFSRNEYVLLQVQYYTWYCC